MFNQNISTSWTVTVFHRMFYIAVTCHVCAYCNKVDPISRTCSKSITKKNRHILLSILFTKYKWGFTLISDKLTDFTYHLLKVMQDVGRFAKLEGIIITQVLPKTRSGKIMRSLIKSILNGNKNIFIPATIDNP